MAHKHGWFDSEGFYSALDRTRQARNLNWKQVASQSGVSASTLTRMAHGKRPDVDGLAALASWAKLSTDEFLRSEAYQGRTEPLAMISTYLRSDRNLTPQDAATLDAVVRATYEQLKNRV